MYLYINGTTLKKHICYGKVIRVQIFNKYASILPSETSGQPSTGSVRLLTVSFVVLTNPSVEQLSLLPYSLIAKFDVLKTFKSTLGRYKVMQSCQRCYK